MFENGSTVCYRVVFRPFELGGAVAGRAGRHRTRRRSLPSVGVAQLEEVGQARPTGNSPYKLAEAPVQRKTNPTHKLGPLSRSQ